MRRYLLRYPLTTWPVIGVILFGLAGRLAWAAAWVTMSLFLLDHFATALWSIRRVPDLMQERTKFSPNVPRWDQLIVKNYKRLYLCMFIVAGLDAGRFRWSSVPPAAQALGVAGFVACTAVFWWCMSVNSFLGSWARIQDDRGHTVVQSGPYSYVRHPMYVSIILFMVCVPLTLGSWWALVPSALITVLFVVRTSLEDSMLRDSLPGYGEYAGRVRYRLLPGLW